MRRINDIIVHCSATPYLRDVHAKDIDAWHRAEDKAGCGYHYVITLDGTIELGRDIAVAGAHCRNHNANSVGICYIGGLDADGRPADTRTDAQRAALAQLIWRISMLCLRMGWGIVPVHGHHDYNRHKHCPCFNAAREFAAARGF